MAMVQNTSSGGAGVRIGSRRMPLPRSRLLRVSIGSGLVLLGMLGFLPVLGFWMIPVGLLILSVDIPRVRRWRRRFDVWFVRRYPAAAAKLGLSNGNGKSNGGKANGAGRRPAA